MQSQEGLDLSVKEGEVTSSGKGIRLSLSSQATPSTLYLADKITVIRPTRARMSLRMAYLQAPRSPETTALGSSSGSIVASL